LGEGRGSAPGESEHEQLAGPHPRGGGPEARRELPPPPPPATPRSGSSTAPRGPEGTTPQDDVSGTVGSSRATATTRRILRPRLLVRQQDCAKKGVGGAVGLIQRCRRTGGDDIRGVDQVAGDSNAGPGPKDKHVDNARMKAEYDEAPRPGKRSRGGASMRGALEPRREAGPARPPPGGPDRLGPAPAARNAGLSRHDRADAQLTAYPRGLVAQGESKTGEVRGGDGRAPTARLPRGVLDTKWRAEWDTGAIPVPVSCSRRPGSKGGGRTETAER